MKSERECRLLFDAFAERVRMHLHRPLLRMGQVGMSYPSWAWRSLKDNSVQQMTIVKYLQPDDFKPHKPLILRIAANFFSFRVSRDICRKLGAEDYGKSTWQLEVSCLPGELIGLAESFATWIRATETGDAERLKVDWVVAPFAGMDLRETYTWTNAAAKVADDYFNRERQQRENLKELRRLATAAKSRKARAASKASKGADRRMGGPLSFGSKESSGTKGV